MQALTSSQIEAPSPLHVAAFAGLTAYAKRLLEGQAPVDPLDAEARTPLHWACARGHAEMVSFLLQKGANPDPEDTRGVKPIHEAARKNHAVIVKLLLEAGVDPLTPKTKENVKRHLVCGEVSTKGETAVEYAWLQGHNDTTLTMLPFLRSETLEELFCQCCRYGKFEVVRALLKAIEISPNATYSGATALYLACRAQNVEIVELLLAKGADVHRTSKWKITNRNVCGGGVREEPVRLPIHGLVVGWKEANNLACQQILRLLLSTGADIEAKDDNGDTTLLSTLGSCNSRVGELFAVKGLLQGGANVLAVDKYGDLVLHRCLRVLKDIKILEVLFEHGAQADVIGKDGNTILHTAMSNFTYSVNGLSLPDVINLLLEKGARCDVKNSDGITALEYAATNMHCNLETFSVLLRACGDVDTVQRCMWRLRAFRGRNDTPGYIRLLQDFGAYLEDRDSEGATVLLKSTDSRELFAAFVECGSDLKAVDFKGRGVLNYYICGRPYEHLHEVLERLVEMVDMGLNPMQVRALNADFWVGTWLTLT
jgi:ankyrin repeat protein